ncbi:hypothetical protein NOR_06572 [Metarhizium rileyi]|uniref:Uncharacterized protein n=1 Tax=Metarhizium rileyi (strain RCEF 4871) TaxID=1649241 RepID=A0A167A4K2_METRR|nr:hypothetical protein NOR_06572 [Metarhizium rileyi RCEF 4871]
MGFSSALLIGLVTLTNWHGVEAATRDESNKNLRPEGVANVDIQTADILVEKPTLWSTFVPTNTVLTVCGGHTIHVTNAPVTLSTLLVSTATGRTTVTRTADQTFSLPQTTLVGGWDGKTTRTVTLPPASGSHSSNTTSSFNTTHSFNTTYSSNNRIPKPHYGLAGIIRIRVYYENRWPPISDQVVNGIWHSLIESDFIGSEIFWHCFVRQTFVWNASFLGEAFLDAFFYGKAFLDAFFYGEALDAFFLDAFSLDAFSLDAFFYGKALLNAFFLDAFFYGKAFLNASFLDAFFYGKALLNAFFHGEAPRCILLRQSLPQCILLRQSPPRCILPRCILPRCILPQCILPRPSLPQAFQDRQL